MKLPGITV